ncbi:MAG: 30S ribosomal protein S6 [Planctomycetota bacterium JB042]
MMVNYYEGMFLTHNKEARKDTDYLAEHITSLVEKAGGKVEKMCKWDERKLAYPIKGVTHGVYFLSYLTADSTFDAKLRAEVRLSGLVLRNLLVRKDAIPEEIETFDETQARLAAASEGTEDGGPPRSGGAPPSRGPAPAAARPAARTESAPAAPATATAPAPAEKTEPAPPAESAPAEATKTEPSGDAGPKQGDS